MLLPCQHEPTPMSEQDCSVIWLFNGTFMQSEPCGLTAYCRRGWAQTAAIPIVRSGTDAAACTFGHMPQKRLQYLHSICSSEHQAGLPALSGTETLKVIANSHETFVTLHAQVNYGRRALERIYQLHTGAINQLVLHEGFCVTASDDRFLRIWPLDFSDFMLEVCSLLLHTASRRKSWDLFR